MCWGRIDWCWRVHAHCSQKSRSLARERSIDVLAPGVVHYCGGDDTVAKHQVACSVRRHAWEAIFLETFPGKEIASPATYLVAGTPTSLSFVRQMDGYHLVWVCRAGEGRREAGGKAGGASGSSRCLWRAGWCRGTTWRGCGRQVTRWRRRAGGKGGVVMTCTARGGMCAVQLRGGYCIPTCYSAC